MQISNKAMETVDSCRFCWMCRHICPIGNATGQERNTARARAMSLSLVKRGAAELKGDILDNVYECALCGGCTEDCITGFDPVIFTKETRLAGALEGYMPEYVADLLDKIEESGNIYGTKEIDDVLKKAISDLPETADVVLFIGKDGAYKTAAKAAKAVELLKKAGVSFTVNKYEPNSGYDMDFLIGAAAETKDVMQKTADILNGMGAKKIVCYDPADAKVFLREYKEYGIGLDAEVVTFTAFVAGLIADGKLAVKKGTKTYTFQDPALLARDLEETEDARKILSACGDIKEMLLCGKATMLAGNLIMNEYLPGVMKLVAENRWENAENVDAKTVVTASPAEYAMLAATKNSDIELVTIEEVVLSCL